MEPIIYTDEKEPDLAGQWGKAWIRDAKAIAERLGQPAPACLGQWIVEARWAHPLWSHYLISCITLRDLPGAKSATVLLPGATHEVMVIALDPEYKRIPLNDAAHFLTPFNFAGQWGQWEAESDAQAIEKVLDAIRDIIINGTLSPDTDYRYLWVERFSDSNLKKGGGENIDKTNSDENGPVPPDGRA